jgi:hypothetical protein
VRRQRTCDEDPFCGCDARRCRLRGDVFSHPIANYMDYAKDRCMSEWTPGQDLRARSLMQRFRGEFFERSPDLRDFLDMLRSLGLKRLIE